MSISLDHDRVPFAYPTRIQLYCQLLEEFLDSHILFGTRLIENINALVGSKLLALILTYLDLLYQIYLITCEGYLTVLGCLLPYILCPLQSILKGSLICDIVNY